MITKHFKSILAQAAHNIQKKKTQILIIRTFSLAMANCLPATLKIKSTKIHICICGHACVSVISAIVTSAIFEIHVASERALLGVFN